ncbi:hypothetical protein BWK58_02925 [Flavobacterium columnare]|nr:hypothetical protein BWG23_06490 [Flavobacterium oreochromis]POR28880.1 hypothetical protein BWK58_02925 [Flavobacterium columnare]
MPQVRLHFLYNLIFKKRRIKKIVEKILLQYLWAFWLIIKKLTNVFVAYLVFNCKFAGLIF